MVITGERPKKISSHRLRGFNRPLRPIGHCTGREFGVMSVTASRLKKSYAVLSKHDAMSASWAIQGDFARVEVLRWQGNRGLVLPT